MGKAVLWTAKICAAVFLTWLVLRRVDLNHALATVARLPPLFWFGALGLLLVQAFISAWRWMLVSRRTAAKLPLAAAIRLFMISLFYNQSLPSTIPGDAARVWGAARFGSLREATIGVFLDRLLTLWALLVLAAVSLGALFLEGHGGIATSVPALALAGGLLAVAVVVAARERLPFFLPNRLGAFATKLADAIHQLFASTDILPLNAISILCHGLSIVTFYILARGLNLPLGLFSIFLVVPVVLLAVLLPISINGWGVREGTMVVMLAGFGISQTEAATLSIVFGLTQLVLGLAGGFFVWLPFGEPDKRVSARKA